jgi:hypothetical protein
MTPCRSRGEIGRARHRANSLNGVFGARLAVCLFSLVFASPITFAGRSQAQVHCLALKSSPLDRCYTGEKCGLGRGSSLLSSLYEITGG